MLQRARKMSENEEKPKIHPESSFETRNEYIEERQLLINLENEVASSFDKALITLSSGAIFLSITFLNKIAGEEPNQICLIVFAWFFLALSLISILSAFLLSQKAMERQREKIDRNIEEGQEAADEIKNNYGWWAYRLSLWSVISFSIGALAFIVFSISNL